MYIGVDYYPEHWPRERWETDARLMKEAGFNVVRMAEFAWIKMEPEEGRYEFSWLDEAIEILGSHGIKTILGTPTASMPAWVALKYPEVALVDKNGRRTPYGNRRFYCHSSATYRYLGQRITRAMAQHYSGNPHVIGWQIDNEFAGPKCYCETCLKTWHEWLKRKYGTIDRLNESWGTIFWSHCYRDFSEVPLPARESSNPSQQLDFARFHSAQVVSFQKNQVDIIRELCPDHFITHNFMGFAPEVDYYDLAKDLDFVSWDYYYNGAPYDKRLESYMSGAASHDLMRGVKGKNYWIMENSAGVLGWETMTRNLRPGEMRRMTFQNMAHGADGQVWFRWRTSRFGTEQYWHGLLSHDGIPGRRYHEAAGVAKELHNISAHIEGSSVVSRAAIMLSYEDRWALDIQKSSETLDYVKHLMKYYRALSRLGINVDFINQGQSLEGYKLLVMPTKFLLPEETAENVKNFVKNGGILITTFRSGVKDMNNLPYELTLPGLLREVTGVRVEEYEIIYNSTKYDVLMDGKTYKAQVFADWIIPETARALATYNEQGLTGYAAVTENSCGLGKAYYIGTEFESQEPYNELVARAVTESGIKAYGPLPEGVEVMVRTKGNTDFIFILNHSDAEVTVNTPDGLELLGGCTIKGQCTLPPGEVAVVKVDKEE